MDPLFPRTLRALEAERPWITGVSLILLAALSVAWLAWSFAGSVSISEVASEARLEVRGAPFPIQAPAQGEIETLNLTVGRRYEKGELLVRFEHGELELKRANRLTAIRDLEEELLTISDRPGLEQKVLESQLQVADRGLEAARSQLREAEINADQASVDAERARRLHQEGQLSRAELDARVAEAERLDALRESQRSVVDGLVAERQRGELSQKVVMTDSGRSLRQLESRLASARNELAEIEEKIDGMSLAAPQAGRLAYVANLAPGQIVSVGEHLASLVADGPIHVVAHFPPARVAGRLRPGQRAWIRLPGFPWTQYGSLTASVSRVANEPLDGLIRVELDLEEIQESQIPVQHGLPASVEIEIEKVAPARLLFRVLGRSLGS